MGKTFENRVLHTLVRVEDRPRLVEDPERYTAWRKRFAAFLDDRLELEALELNADGERTPVFLYFDPLTATTWRVDRAAAVELANAFANAKPWNAIGVLAKLLPDLDGATVDRRY